jgi:lysozyme
MQNKLQPSAVCLALLRRFEGCSLVVYRDAVGILTTGWGHKLLPDESFPQGITQAIADGLLQSDAQIAGRDVNALVTVELNQSQFDGLTSWTYNLGGPRLRESTLLRFINAEDFAAVPEEWMQWRMAGDRVLPGLVARRAAELALWNTGVYPQ